MTHPVNQPQKLYYATAAYRHRLNKWIGFAIFTGMCTTFVVGTDWIGRGFPIFVQCLMIAVPAILTACAYRYGWAAECRVEGDHLWFAAENVPPTNVPVADIVSIDRVDVGEGYDFELSVRGKGRMRVAADVFQPIEPLREALLARNPDIHFGQRDGIICGACGGFVFPPGSMPRMSQVIRLWRVGRCPVCGEPFPKYGRFV
jgi:hypothetical protein